MKKTVLRISGLRVERGDVVILHDLSWSARQGEHWLILGPNGSGKTSLLSVLTGYLEPTAGDIELLGKVFGKSDWRELRQRVGLVSSSIRQMMDNSEPALETVVSGKYGMIDYWGEMKASHRLRAEQILRQIECFHLAERPWRVLSQGERQRILIGRSLMADPPLLILDEPCAGLDPVAREHFLGFLERLGKRPAAPTLVLVTHHVEEIIPLFTHVLLLREGTAVASGNIPQTLTTRYLSAAFGSPIELERDGDRYRLKVASAGRHVM